MLNTFSPNMNNSNINGAEKSRVWYHLPLLKTSFLYEGGARYLEQSMPLALAALHCVDQWDDSNHYVNFVQYS